MTHPPSEAAPLKARIRGIAECFGVLELHAFGSRAEEIREVTSGELYEICQSRVGDIDETLDAILHWVPGNPDRVDRSV